MDISAALQEIVRVAKPGATFLVNEIYSHSLTETVRRSHLVSVVLYPRMRRLIYGTHEPYITQDERKLNESDVRLIRRVLSATTHLAYFNFIVTRLIPDRFSWAAKLDRVILGLLRPGAHFLAGRMIFAGPIRKGG